jgi:hypothetical protein
MNNYGCLKLLNNEGFKMSDNNYKQIQLELWDTPPTQEKDNDRKSRKKEEYVSNDFSSSDPFRVDFTVDYRLI